MELILIMISIFTVALNGSYLLILKSRFLKKILFKIVEVLEK